MIVLKPRRVRWVNSPAEEFDRLADLALDVVEVAPALSEVAAHKLDRAGRHDGDVRDGDDAVQHGKWVVGREVIGEVCLGRHRGV